MQFNEFDEQQSIKRNPTKNNKTNNVNKLINSKHIIQVDIIYNSNT